MGYDDLNDEWRDTDQAEIQAQQRVIDEENAAEEKNSLTLPESVNVVGFKGIRAAKAVKFFSVGSEWFVIYEAPREVTKSPLYSCTHARTGRGIFGLLELSPDECEESARGFLETESACSLLKYVNLHPTLNPHFAPAQ